jgi:Lrp/AsnC family transcriptional regulator, leucine-responsive regulatory protein
MEQLDAYDRKLLQLVQCDNQLSAQEMSEKVHLSPASCLRRLKRLRDKGVIRRNIALLDPLAIGRSLQMVVLVSLERERYDIVTAFKRWILETPEIVQCHYVASDIDYVLLISVVDMKDYEAFAQRFFTENRNVRRFSTLVVMSEVKIAGALPIDIA